MKIFAALFAVMMLASCGIDGAPLRPSAEAGISIGTGGVDVGGKVSVGKGPVTISVGL